MKKIIVLGMLLLLGLALVFTQVGAFPSGASAAPSTDSLEVTKTPKTKPGKPEKAAKPASHAGKKINIKGVVASFDGGALVLTLNDQSTLSIAVDGATQVRFAGPKDLLAPDLQKDDQVMVQAVKDAGGVLLALQVHVIPGKPARVHRVGKVTGYTPGVSITITDQKGATGTFLITGDTRILPEARKGDLQVGARVTVISPRRPADGPPVAQGIVVHPAD